MEVYPADEGKGALLHVRARPLSPRIRQPWHLLDRLDFFNLLDHADLVLENPIVKRLGLAASREKAEEVLADDEFETPFHVILEPLVLGVLPRTAVPAVLAILVMLVGAGLAAPRVAAALERLAVQVKVEKEE
jgi:hypothetical protein